MKYLFFLALLFLSGCEFSRNQYEDLKTENSILKRRIDSLNNEINDLKFGSKNLLEDAKLKSKGNDFIQAKSILNTLISKYPDSKEASPAKTLLKTVRPKAESQLFNNAVSGQDIELLKNYTTEYPKGKYYKQAKNLIQQYQKKASRSNYNSAATNKKAGRATVGKTKSNYGTSGTRVGAICCDGTRSYATGRGACSHHGGVCEWLYH